MHSNIREGTPILTFDGERLGEVKEIRGDFFKVDAPMAPDYWLACDCVTADGGNNLRVSFTKDQVDTYKRGEPAPASV
jgi:hypothetical protein